MNIALSPESFTLVKGRGDPRQALAEGDEIVVTAPLPEGFSGFAVVRLTAEAEAQPEVRLGLCPSREAEPLLSFHYRILPRCAVQVPFALDARALAADYAFLPPWPGVFKGGMNGRAIRAEEARWLRLAVRAPGLRGLRFEGVTLTDVWEPQPVEGEPLVDALGQRRQGTWPGKTQSPDELCAYLQTELQWAKEHNAYPDGWSRYGGWTEKRFEATGWFRRQHDGRRWWLVDPEGYAFFSNGMCYGNRTGIYGMADHLDSLHEWLPPRTGLTAGAWTTGDQIPQYVVRNGREGAEKRELVNFPRANMMRAFGDQWLDAWITINAARMRRWGVNTVGVGVNDYGDEHTRAFLERARIPYVVTFKFFALTKERIFRDFPDVFSDEYASAAAEMARRELTPYRDDPYLLGYFVTNEPEWLMHENVSLAAQLLARGDCAASKRELIRDLEARYGDIAGLNAAWGTAFAGFDDLLRPYWPDAFTGEAQADLDRFHQRLVEAYGRVVSTALRTIDPHHMNLGMRYSRASERTLCGPLNYFDAFSFNCYGAEPETAARAIGRHVDLPMLVGEWHIGAKDTGLPAWGLYYTDTQAQRARAVAYYLERSTQEPHLTGTHYFEYGDQPYLGRFDGECYQIGLIDVCNRPYPLVAKAFEDFAGRMYPLLDGRLEPTAPAEPLYSMA